jgi:hypothetical protein
MIKLTIAIDLDNSAFENDRIGELQRLFENLCERLPEEGATSAEISLRDSNGNWVGSAQIIDA